MPGLRDVKKNKDYILIDKREYYCYYKHISIRYMNNRYGDAYVRIYNFRDAYAKRNERI